MSRRRHLAAVLCVLATACDRGEERYAIVFEAYGGSFDALLAGTELEFLARGRDDTGRAISPVMVVERDLGANEPFEYRLDLEGPGRAMVHVAARGAGGLYVATRCITVAGVRRVEVLLTGPIEDADGDSWPLVDDCRERGREGMGCDDQCPEDLATDCDDSPDPDDAGLAAAGINPGAAERCQDGVDQDCDGADAECEDADGDGFTGCPPDVDDTTSCDCDDSDGDVNPGVVESADPRDGLCENDVDDDCDGGDLACDGDGDGVPSCIPDGPTSCDCDDTNEDVMPGASEVPGGRCDGLDNNCNGLVDEVSGCLSDDLDGDGSTAAEDCNDCNAGSAPGQTHLTCGNGVDEDCVGGDEACSAGDADGDGFVGEWAGGSDCDDGDPTIYPGAPDRCGDGSSSDCSGGGGDGDGDADADSTCEDDGDRDGWNVVDDCDDGDPSTNPAQRETCNGVDDDCDGVVDDVGSAGVGCVLMGGEWVDIDFESDLLNCGGCRNDCNAACDGTLCQADSCDSGSCTCAGGPPCGGDRDDQCCPDGCTDLTNDVNNCGGCGAICPDSPCHVAICESGECSTEPEPDGVSCGGGRYCCGGGCGGECAPGDTATEACEQCGARERRCTDDCTWGPWGSCNGQGEPCP